MSDNRVSWIFLATLIIAAAWGIWLKLNEPEPEEPEIRWVRVGGKLVERDSQEPYQGVRVLPFEGAPGMVQWEYTYVDGVRQGAAIEYYPSPNKKVKSRSIYVDGKLEGPVIHYHSNGVVMSKSTAVAGLLDGLVTFYQEDGTVRERSVYDRSAPAGVPAIVAEPALEEEAQSEGGDPGAEGELAGDAPDETGEIDETDEKPLVLGPDGEPFTGTQIGTFFGGAKAFERGYLDGRPHGMHQGWEPDGQLEFEQPYAEGEKHGVWKRWAENGQLVSESTFHHGLQSGSAKTWFPNEQARQQSQFAHGAEHGLRTNHDASGLLRRETRFDHGIQTARKDWSRRGELAMDETTPLLDGQALGVAPGDQAVTELLPITEFPADLDGGLVLGLRYRVSTDDPDPPAGAARPFRLSIVQNGEALGFFDFPGELGGWRTHEWVINLMDGDTLELELETGAGGLQIHLDGIGFEEEDEESEIPLGPGEGEEPEVPGEPTGVGE